MAHHVAQEFQRTSRFTYVAGDPTATRASQQLLYDAAPRVAWNHNGGWLGFKPSDYATEVREDKSSVNCRRLMDVIAKSHGEILHIEPTNEMHHGVTSSQKKYMKASLTTCEHWVRSITVV